MEDGISRLDLKYHLMTRNATRDETVAVEPKKSDEEKKSGSVGLYNLTVLYPAVCLPFFL